MAERLALAAPTGKFDLHSQLAACGRTARGRQARLTRCRANFGGAADLAGVTAKSPPRPVLSRFGTDRLQAMAFRCDQVCRSGLVRTGRAASRHPDLQAGCVPRCRSPAQKQLSTHDAFCRAGCGAPPASRPRCQAGRWLKGHGVVRPACRCVGDACHRVARGYRSGHRGGRCLRRFAECPPEFGEQTDGVEFGFSVHEIEGLRRAKAVERSLIAASSKIQNPKSAAQNKSPALGRA
jgi:hypothetical protein